VETDRVSGYANQIGLVDMPIGEAEIGNYYDQMEAEAMQEVKEMKEANKKAKLKKRKKRKK